MALVPWPSRTATTSLNKARSYLREAIGALDLSGDRVDRLGRVAAALVQRYAPSAPEEIMDEAVVRFTGYLAQSDFGAIRGETIGPRGVEYQTNHAAAFRNSGAAMLLSPWRVRRAGVIGDKSGAAAPSPPDQVDTQPERPDMPTKLPAVRLFLLRLSIPDLTAVTLPNMSGQEIVDAGTEILAVTKRAISVAAPVYCHQQTFHLASPEREFLAVAVPDGQDRPSHFRVNASAVPNAWDWPQPPTANNLGFVWTEATGQAVIDGASFDVFRWPQLQSTFPAECVFEWPA